MRRFPILRALLIVGLAAAALLSLFGCTSDRERATADAAATIWEGADAIQKGVPAAMVAPAIKANAAAIIRAQGVEYPPAQVTP
jgi:hypothetical protein